MQPQKNDSHNEEQNLKVTRAISWDYGVIFIRLSLFVLPTTSTMTRDIEEHKNRPEDEQSQQ
jgi:hypothetical protein